MADKIKESIAVMLGVGFLAFVAGIENYNLEMGTKACETRAVHHSEFGAKKLYRTKTSIDSLHSEVGQQRMARN